MKRETRDQQYLRILVQGPSGKEDFEAVRYLKEKGYTDSPVRLSNMLGTYNQVAEVVWLGPTANGLDFIDALRARTQQPEAVYHQNPDEYPHQKPGRTRKPLESPWIQIAVGVAVLVLFGIVSHFFDLGLGIRLK
jgi:hypothetical protein